jgi:hypothetical protein
MSTFTDPQQPESFEHNGLKPEVEVTEADVAPTETAEHETAPSEPAAGSEAPSADTESAGSNSTATDSTDSNSTDEPDSFDTKLESEFKEFVGEATPIDGPAPAG